MVCLAELVVGEEFGRNLGSASAGGDSRGDTEGGGGGGSLLAMVCAVPHPGQSRMRRESGHCAAPEAAYSGQGQQHKREEAEGTGSTEGLCVRQDGCRCSCGFPGCSTLPFLLGMHSESPRVSPQPCCHSDLFLLPHSPVLPLFFFF